MVLYKISDLKVKMHTFSKKAGRNYENYIEKEDIIADIVLENKRFKSEKQEKNHLTTINFYGKQISPALHEYITTGLDFARALLNYNGFCLHSSAIAVDNKAVLFAAKSGTGKSTHTRLWREYFGEDKAVMINDDKPAIRLMDDGFRIAADRQTRGIFAYVPQGNFLLSGTIRENIAFIRPEATEEEIIQAAELSCAMDFIEELPMGMDTIIGEKGLGLSEGQVQRLAIARALLGGAPILLLDEVTSALDAQTEKQVLENIKCLRNRTCLIVTHKAAALAVCDVVLRFVDGKIIMEKR